MKERFFDFKLLKFILVGIGNTLIGTGITYALYELAHFGYWGSSAWGYIIGSVFSFFCNKNFTFKNRDTLWKTALKFAVNVAVCYLLAYGLAKPAVLWILSGSGWSEVMIERIAIAVGVVLFTGFNYIGQRYFAFRQTNQE